MDDKIVNLDQEFKRYLQILRPYLGQLVEQEPIKICNEWIQRLSNCSEEEKVVRNKYIFMLCYQLAKGVLEEPFTRAPPACAGALPAVADLADSEASSDLEDAAADEVGDARTQVLYDNRRDTESDTDGRHDCDVGSTRGVSGSTSKDVDSLRPTTYITDDSSQATRKQTILCYNCPKLDMGVGDLDHNPTPEHYEYRANNLIMRLREIKKQNILLQREIDALKEESKGRSCDSFSKVDIATCTYGRLDSCTMINSLKTKLQEADEEKRRLAHTIDTLQFELEKKDDDKNREVEDLIAKHKIEVIKIKTSLRDENKLVYDERLSELTNHYEQLIDEMKKSCEIELDSVLQSRNKVIAEKEQINQTKNKEIQQIRRELEELSSQILEKDKVIQEKDSEISHLKSQIEEDKNNLHCVLNKFLENSTDTVGSENLKLKAQDLEKRLSRMEKSRMKCLKAYEAKLANMQKEKQMAECSLQMQLVKQRAQIVSEMTEEHQAELAAALNKLEAKYKDIVANVQSAAIQRRMRDEVAINAILQAACSCGLQNEVFSEKITNKRVNKECSHSCESEISGAACGGGGAGGRAGAAARRERSFGSDSAGAGGGGYCLRGEQLGRLLDRLYVPQRDLDSPARK